MTVFHKGDFPEEIEKEIERLPKLVDEALRKSKYISREDALNAILNILKDKTAIYNGRIDPYYVINKITYLPSADVRPVVRGEWLLCASTKDLMCSNCLHYWIPNGDQDEYHYCPNCGARMDGDVK